jgi:hypothetical protein
MKTGLYHGFNYDTREALSFMEKDMRDNDWQLHVETICNALLGIRYSLERNGWQLIHGLADTDYWVEFPFGGFIFDLNIHRDDEEHWRPAVYPVGMKDDGMHHSTDTGRFISIKTTHRQR